VLLKSRGRERRMNRSRNPILHQRGVYSLCVCAFAVFPGSLQIQQSLESDEGKYECVAENSVGVAYSYGANLYVRGMIDFSVCRISQRRILGILLYEFVTNEEVATLSQLPSMNETISRRRHSLFGHVRRMDQAAPAHQALHLSVTSRQGSRQFGTWRRQPGRPRNCWVEQVTTSTGLAPSDAWSVATNRRIGQREGRYDPSTVKRREKECACVELVEKFIVCN